MQSLQINYRVFLFGFILLYFVSGIKIDFLISHFFVQKINNNESNNTNISDTCFFGVVNNVLSRTSKDQVGKLYIFLSTEIKKINTHIHVHQILNICDTYIQSPLVNK